MLFKAWDLELMSADQYFCADYHRRDLLSVFSLLCNFREKKKKPVKTAQSLPVMRQAIWSQWNPYLFYLISAWLKFSILLLAFLGWKSQKDFAWNASWNMEGSWLPVAQSLPSVRKNKAVFQYLLIFHALHMDRSFAGCMPYVIQQLCISCTRLIV